MISKLLRFRLLEFLLQIDDCLATSERLKRSSEFQVWNKPTTDITPAGCSKHWATSDSWWAMSLDWDLVHSVPLKLRARQCHFSFNVICERRNGSWVHPCVNDLNARARAANFHSAHRITPNSFTFHSPLLIHLWQLFVNSMYSRCVFDRQSVTFF